MSKVTAEDLQFLAEMGAGPVDVDDVLVDEEGGAGAGCRVLEVRSTGVSYFDGHRLPNGEPLYRDEPTVDGEEGSDA